MYESELPQRLGPGDELIWGDIFDNRIVSDAVFYLGAHKYGELAALTEQAFLDIGLNTDEIAVIRRVLGAPGRGLRLASDEPVDQNKYALEQAGSLGQLAAAQTATMPGQASGKIIPFPPRPIDRALRA